jgi:hypothetical protein
LNPNFSNALAARSTALGSGDGLAGAMMPMVSPKLSRSGLSKFFMVKNYFLARKFCFKTTKMPSPIWAGAERRFLGGQES